MKQFPAMSRLAPSLALLVAAILVVSITGALGQRKANYVAPSGQQPSVGRVRRSDGQTSTCADNNVQCTHWAAGGFCDSRYVYNGFSVRDSLCRASCKTCTPAGCSDQVARCSKWANKGQCAAGWLYQNQPVRDVVCRESCGACGDQGGQDETASPPPASSPPPPPASSPPPPPASSPPPPPASSPPPPTDDEGGEEASPPPPPTDEEGGEETFPSPSRRRRRDRLSPPPPPPTTSGGASGSCSDANTILDQHNTYRARHSAPALRWDSTLERQATSWAQQLARSGCNLRHGGYPDDVGQNLYASYGGGSQSSTCTPGLTGWYDEVRNYRFTSRPYSDNRNTGTGHFTQVVWIGTTRVGCGVAIGNNCRVVACNYAPAGNIIGDSYYYNNVKRN